MKPFLLACVLLALCFALPASLAREPPPVPEYGVGFSLSLDYGTCSVYFPNGTYVDVGKIEGSPRYKNVMRQLESDDIGLPDERSTWQLFLSRLTQDLPIPSIVSSSLTRWQHRSPEAVAIEEMLRALKTAAESYLGLPAPIADSAIATPFSPSGRRVLDSAFRSADISAGLYKTHLFRLAGYLAARANGIGTNGCYESTPSPSNLVLTVDYSRAALTAALFVEDTCLFDHIRLIHDVNLGTDGLDKCQQSKQTPNCHKGLEEALFQITKMPVEQAELKYPIYSDTPVKINALALHGEKGTDPQLRRVLQQVLAEHSLPTILEDSPQEGNAMVDPTFAPAREIARISWDSQLWCC